MNTVESHVGRPPNLKSHLVTTATVFAAFIQADRTELQRCVWLFYLRIICCWVREEFIRK